MKPKKKYDADIMTLALFSMTMSEKPRKKEEQKSQSIVSKSNFIEITSNHVYIYL